MRPLISVIIPVYNSESTINRCVESILKQNFKNFELIIVDDGSKDNSLIICEEYQRKDKRVKVFHKENGGVSSARNIGIENAEAEWITFADSDDYAESNWLQLFVDNISSSVDIIIQGFDILEFERVEKKHTGENYSGSVSNGIEYLDSTIGYIFCKLFRRRIILEYCIKFNESFKIFEDEDFVLKYMTHVDIMASISEGAYQYFMPNWNKKYGANDDFYCNISRLSSIRTIMHSQPSKPLYFYIYILCYSYAWSIAHKRKELLKRTKDFWHAIKGVRHLCAPAIISVYKSRHN